MKKRKGASTIFLLFMIIVLVILGLFTIVSANINFKLSEKAVSWNEKYYELDKLCEQHLGTIDEILVASEKEAVQFILDGYIKEQDYNKEEIYNVMNDKYKRLAIDKLDKLSNNEDSFLNIEYGDVGEISTLEYSKIIKSEVDENYQIEIILSVKDILYEINFDNDSIKAEKIFYQDRFNIKQWKQYQEVEEVDSGYELWNPDDTFKTNQ